MTNNELLKQALDERRGLRDANAMEESRRRMEAEQKCPQIGVLLDQQRAGILQGLQSALAGTVPHGIEEATQRRNTQIAALLKQNGFADDYLAPIYSCPDCQDRGYAGDSSRRLCHCVLSRYQTLLQGDAWQDEQQTFENYDENRIPATPMPGMEVSQRAYTRLLREQCERFADSLPETKTRNLLLYGSSGLGKTYLLRAIGVRASQRGIPVLSLTANNLLNQIRKHYFSREEEEAAPYMEVPLLLIDDLGTEPLWENITVEQLFALIDHRLNRGLHTVISTNLNLTELKARYTERIMSRLLDLQYGRKLAFMGRDLRLIENR